MILRFVNFEDYVQHLKSKKVGVTHLEPKERVGKANKYGIAGVTFLAVASARLMDEISPYIALWETVITQTTTADLEWERMKKDIPPEETTRNKIWNKVDKIKSTFEKEGIQVKPGRWLEERR
jgi:hypothetical protein